MNREIRSSLAFAGAILLAATALTIAYRSGWVDGDAPTRFVMVLNGALVAWSSNMAPKLAPRGRPGSRLVIGRAMVLAGLFYAGVWIVAPMDLALPLSIAGILIGLGLSVGFCLLSRRDTPNTHA